MSIQDRLLTPAEVAVLFHVDPQDRDPVGRVRADPEYPDTGRQSTKAHLSVVK